MKIAICDDDFVFASKVEDMVLEISKKQDFDVEVEVYLDGSELWNDIVAGKIYELVYLDIEMVRLNGIELARKIREIDLNIILIYISSHENYFIELFEVEPFRFIKKPIDEVLFRNYFNKAYDRIRQNEAYFEYRFNKAFHRVLLKNIVYFESSSRVITIHYRGGQEKFYEKLNTVEKQLYGGTIPFLRIHQSFLVNYRYIRKISFSRVTLFDGRELQISEDRQKKTRERYNELLGGEFFDG